MTKNKHALDLDLVCQLPEKEYALFCLGLSLHNSFQMACLRRTDDDKAYMREVADRMAEVMGPDGREEFKRWFDPGGILRL